MAAKASTEPGWAETSVRWLRAHHTEYVPATSKRPAVTLLRGALVKMKYLRHAMAAFAEERWYKHLDITADEWTSGDHSRMVAFLKAGGHDAAVKKTAEEVAVRRASMAVTAAETMKVTSPDGTTEEFGIELEDLDKIEEAIVKDRAPRSQLSPKHELEEIVASAALASDPRYGVW